MNVTRSSIIWVSMLTFCLCGQAQAQYVRVAELEIDPAQLDVYKAAITEGVQAAVRSEPGVLVLYAVHEKENPNRSESSRFIRMQPLTRHIWKRRISSDSGR